MVEPTTGRSATLPAGRQRSVPIFACENREFTIENKSWHGGEEAKQRSVSLREIPRSGTKPHMYFTYILHSLKNGDLYIGSTENVEKRIILHNAGKVRSTKPYRPWTLLECRGFNSRSEAVQSERFLKNHQQKEILRKKYGLMAKG